MSMRVPQPKPVIVIDAAIGVSSTLVMSIPWAFSCAGV